MNKKTWLVIIIFLALGIFFRMWHIEFGLPHSFHADEPEIVELAIKYTYEIRSIVRDRDYYKLIPISYVYGMFPTYLFTFLTMFFSKTCGIFHIIFDKTAIYVFLRTVNSLISILIIPASAFLYWKIFKNKIGVFVTLFLLTFNWKLIVHAHYVNPDILLTTLVSLSLLTFYFYSQKDSDHLFTILTAVLLGLAVGTKITALITLPMYLLVFVHKKDFKGLTAFLLIIFGTFVVTNPFSLVFRQDFVFRVASMLTKEGGLVFDSVDGSPLKYLFGLSWMLTFPVFLVSIYGIFKSKKDTYQYFLVGNVLLYLLFFSIQSRRVDRWLLPVLPIITIYASRGIVTLIENKNRIIAYSFLSLVGIYYLYFPTLLLTQFQRYTPKAQAYLWAKENISATSMILGYTEEGLDPLNKLVNERVYQFNVYESENAQFFLPENPEYYEYIIITSKVMQNYRKKEVAQKFPFYIQKWILFENELKNSGSYVLEKTFELTKPNLIPLSDVYIYRNLNPKPFL